MNKYDVLITKIRELTNSLQESATKSGEIANELENFKNVASDVSVTTIDPIIYAITVLIMACFIGYYVIWRVTPALHAPLMAVTNAISGIIIIGAMIAAGTSEISGASILGYIAVVLASINIFGGFLVTHRMLSMFRKK